MNSSIKIVKRNLNKSPNSSPDLETRKSHVRQEARDVASTVKSWVTELQQRKRAETCSLAQVFGAPVGQNI